MPLAFARPAVIGRVAGVALAAGVAVGGCRAPEPPNLPPDFVGIVVGRTPRLNAPRVPARLVVEARAPTSAPGVRTRVIVEVRPGARVLEERPGGGYRVTTTSEAWLWRTVHVWFADDPPSGGAGHGDGRARPAVTVVAVPED